MSDSIKFTVIVLIIINFIHLSESFKENIESSVSNSNDPQNLSINKYTNIKNNNIKRQDQGKCQDISVPMCLNMPYNMTSMPNQFNHYTQHEAAMEAHQFYALVEINCSKDLRFFLCSMYTPICIPNYKQQVKACKSVCVRARLGCEKYLKKFGFEWPEHMNCDLFPEYGTSKDVCMDPIDATQQSTNKQFIINHNLNKNINIIDRKVTTKSTPKKTLIHIEDDSENGSVQDTTNFYSINKLSSVSAINQLSDTLCKAPFIKLTKNDQYGNVGYLPNCIQSCSSSNNPKIYFTEWQQTFTYYWLMIWTILCMFSSLCTTFSYLIEPDRFKYPEKPIIYLSICYLFVSFGYLLRYIFGQEQMNCTYGLENNSLDNKTTNLPCILTFIFIYYFGMASSVWWVIVSLTWFLAAGLKWGCESISKYVKYFHLAAWLLPFIKTCIILSLSYVDSDSLTGICYVGNLNVNNLRLFVLIPSIIYLTLGITFLIAGFISLIRIRNMIKRQNGDLTKAHKLEKLMIRIGIFSILYTVPATCVMACQFYEQYYRSDWEKNVMCKNFFSNDGINLNESKLNMVKTFCYSSKSNQNEIPDFSIFMLKYFMSLIVGVTSGFWIWTNKTVKSWNGFFDKFFSCCLSSNRNISDTSNDIESAVDGVSKKNQPQSCCNIFNQESNKNIAKTRRDSIVYFQPPNNDDNNLFFDDKNQHSSSTESNNNLVMNQQNYDRYINHQNYRNNITKPTESNNTATISQQYYPINYDQQALLKLQQQQHVHSNRADFYYDFCSSSAISAATNNTRNNTGTCSSKYSIPSSVGSKNNLK